VDGRSRFVVCLGTGRNPLPVMRLTVQYQEESDSEGERVVR